MGVPEVTATMKRDPREEEAKHEAKRVLHEFAVYVVWHLSMTKPNETALRVLVNELMQECAENDFICGTPNCEYCNTKQTRRRFRQIFRKLVGSSERGK